jgi:hypothetical protein
MSILHTFYQENRSEHRNTGQHAIILIYIRDDCNTRSIQCKAGVGNCFYYTVIWGYFSVSQWASRDTPFQKFYRPWRWQMQCVSKYWKIFNIRYGLFPKAGVIQISQMKQKTLSIRNSDTSILTSDLCIHVVKTCINLKRTWSGPHQTFLHQNTWSQRKW